ncbi:MAG: hypothetical protein RLT05_05490 [Bauldia litoralis]
MDHFRYLVIAAALFVAGCDNAPPAQDAQPEPPAAEAPAPAEAEAPATEEAAAPSEAPAAEPEPQATAADTTTVTNDACLAAAKAETNESDVTVVSNDFSEANTIVMLGVGANRAPWKCLVSNDGNVEEISFQGNDGDGVPMEGADADDGGGAMAGAPGGSDVSQAAIDACLEAVQAQTNEPNQGVLSTEFSEANSLVMVGVGEQQAPWKCLVSNDGVVAEVSFDGDEGAL